MNTKAKKWVKEMTQEKRIDLYKKLQQDLIEVSEEIDEFKRPVRDQKEIIQYFRSIAPFDKEAVFVLYLDAKMRVIDYKQEFGGTLTQSVIYPREIIKTAIDKAALSIVLCHNHPSGNTTPSDADRKITKKLLFACKHMDIQLLDHVIIGAGEDYYSFYANGMIERYNGEYRNLSEVMEGK
jgi:DNA repair protein RadC